MTRTRSVLTLLGMTFLAGCDDEPAQVPVEVLLGRATAFRQACAARELLRIAQDDVVTLESLSASPGMQSAAAATLQFARAFQRHADVRATAYALVDSAANHSVTPADSVRFMERAQAFTINFPQPGTVEANVLNNYETKLSTIMLDDDHRCNWDIPNLQPDAEKI